MSNYYCSINIQDPWFIEASPSWSLLPFHTLFWVHWRHIHTPFYKTKKVSWVWKWLLLWRQFPTTLQLRFPFFFFFSCLSQRRISLIGTRSSQIITKLMIRFMVPDTVIILTIETILSIPSNPTMHWMNK